MNLIAVILSMHTLFFKARCRQFQAWFSKKIELSLAKFEIERYLLSSLLGFPGIAVIAETRAASIRTDIEGLKRF